MKRSDCFALYVIFINMNNSVSKMVVISSGHLNLNDMLAKDINALAGKFDSRDYSKIENIDTMLLRRDLSIERKKEVLVKKLHGLVAKTFAINKKKISKSDFSSLAARILGIRKIVLKLRSINHYLETKFLSELNLLKIKIPLPKRKFHSRKSLINNELEALEYMAYKLIGKVVVLDKNLLGEYAGREKKVLAKEKAEIKDLGTVLGKESEALEHLEAKLPPPRLLPAALLKEPMFTQWVSRVLALLSYIEHQHSIETKIFSKLKKNKLAKARINKKIAQLARECSRLLDIMDDKAHSMNKLKLDDEVRRELGNLTATITL